jgi:PAS domain S-box-containing protein
VVMDRDGKVVDWNENATKVFGWATHEVLGRNMADLIIPPQYREAHARGLRRFLQTGEAKVLGRRIEISGLRRCGEEFPVELSISSLSVEDDLIFVGFLRDISDLKHAERQREQHALKMEALYRAISFAAENHSFDDALRVCLASVQKLTGWPLGHVYLPSGTEPIRLVPSPIWLSARPDAFESFRAVTRETTFAPGEGLPGRIWLDREPLWIADVDADANFPRAKRLEGIGIKSAFGFTILSANEVIAVIEFFSETPAQRDFELLLTLRAIGEQVGRVFERRRAEQALQDHAAALEIEIEERKRVEDQQSLLLAEVNHRVKNMLAVVTAIAAQTARNSTSIESFNQSFLSRLGALSEAHSLLTTRNWQAASLKELVDAVLSPYRAEPCQLDIVGASVAIPAKAVLSVGMILHELVTNAAKYGALSLPTGKVLLEWEVDTLSEPKVRMRWIETGAGPVSPPIRTGFGSVMIRASIQHDLKGRLNTSYGDDGVRYDFEFPLRQPS